MTDAAVQDTKRRQPPIDFSLGLAAHNPPLCRSDAERGTIIGYGSRNQCMCSSTERGRRENAPTMGEISARI